MDVPGSVELGDALPRASRRDQRRIAVADALTTEWPKILERSGIGADTCILGVRVGMDVFQNFDFRTRPLPVRTNAFNAAAMKRRNREPYTGDAVEIVLGYKDDRRVDPEHYNGHLIFVVDDKLAVDLTAHQMSLPEHGIEIPALFFPCERKFLRGEDTIGLSDPGQGWHVIYVARPDDKTWASATDFKARDYRQMNADTQFFTELLRRQYGLKPATRGRR